MLFSRVRRWVTESLRPQSSRTARRPKWVALVLSPVENGGDSREKMAAYMRVVR